jgi:hypothetical protein
VLTMLLAISGHAAAGGAAPDLGLAAVLFVLLAGLFVALADQRAGPGAVLALVGAGQLGIHVLLQALSVHDFHSLAPDHLAGPAGGAGIDPVTMTAAHVGATVLTGWLLATADRALFMVAAAWARMVRRRVAPLPARRPLLLAAAAPGVIRGDFGLRLAQVATRRGPPVLV